MIADKNTEKPRFCRFCSVCDAEAVTGALTFDNTNACSCDSFPCIHDRVHSRIVRQKHTKKPGTGVEEQVQKFKNLKLASENRFADNHKLGGYHGGISLLDDNENEVVFLSDNGQTNGDYDNGNSHSSKIGVREEAKIDAGSEEYSKSYRCDDPVPEICRPFHMSGSEETENFPMVGENGGSFLQIVKPKKVIPSDCKAAAATILEDMPLCSCRLLYREIEKQKCEELSKVKTKRKKDQSSDSNTSDSGSDDSSSSSDSSSSDSSPDSSDSLSSSSSTSSSSDSEDEESTSDNSDSDEVKKKRKKQRTSV